MKKKNPIRQGFCHFYWILIIVPQIGSRRSPTMKIRAAKIPTAVFLIRRERLPTQVIIKGGPEARGIIFQNNRKNVL